jgi:uncharacterized protein (TIGR00369 family)
MTGEETIRVTFPEEEVERLRAVADDPAALLREAGMRRVQVEEAIEATFDDGDGEAGPGDALSGDRPLAPIGATIGFQVASAGDGEASVVLDAGREHANPMGTLHGGVLCDLGDAAMGIAYASTLGPEESFTTLELHVNYLRPVWDDRLTAVGRVVNRGRTVGLVECDVRNAEEQLVARLSSTCLTLRGEAAAGR